MISAPRVLGAVAIVLLLSSAARAADPTPTPTPTPTPAPPTPTPTPPAPPSPEAVADAARQSELGRQAFKAKRFAQAAHLYDAAAALGRQPSAYFSAALAWELAERSERAADAFARALANTSGGEALGAPEASQAKDRLDTLERSLGTLDVKAPAGWTVQLDGAPEAPAPARLHGVAGIHSLAVAAPDRPIARRDVRLEIGKPLALALKDEPLAKTPVDGPKRDAAPAPAAPVAPRIVMVEPSGQVRRAIGFTAMGLGVASLGAALVLGLETVDARNAFNASPSRPLYDHEQTLQTWTNVTLIGGAILAVGGAVLVLWPSSNSAEATVGFAPSLGGGSLVGRF